VGSQRSYCYSENGLVCKLNYGLNCNLENGYLCTSTDGISLVNSTYCISYDSQTCF
jgi:hypothetical protein